MCVEGDRGAGSEHYALRQRAHPHARALQVGEDSDVKVSFLRDAAHQCDLAADCVCSAWEKLNRATLTSEASKARNTGSSQQAGPMVATIFVRGCMGVTRYMDCMKNLVVDLEF